MHIVLPLCTVPVCLCARARSSQITMLYRALSIRDKIEIEPDSDTISNILKFTLFSYRVIPSRDSSKSRSYVRLSFLDP